MTRESLFRSILFRTMQVEELRKEYFKLAEKLPIPANMPKFDWVFKDMAWQAVIGEGSEYATLFVFKSTKSNDPSGYIFSVRVIVNYTQVSTGVDFPDSEQVRPLMDAMLAAEAAAEKFVNKLNERSNGLSKRFSQ